MVTKSRACSKGRTSEGFPMSDQMTDTQSGPERSVDPKLLELLVCPVTKATLDYDAVRQELVSRPAKLAYPVRDGIPIMLPEEARRLD
jgi:uncharacterized protein YbaR (Trm112 family)